jgi:glycyl-tRNA synthetase beta chain
MTQAQKTLRIKAREDVGADLLAFFHDRLKVYLRDKGARHDLIDAALASGANDDLVLIVRRIDALAAMLDSEDGKNLLAGYKRAANIVRAEEKKDGAGHYDKAFDPALAQQSEETHLAQTLNHLDADVRALIGQDQFAAAVKALSALRGPVDAFFEHVTVNDADPALRLNRLCLLNHLRRVMHGLADFSKMSG